MIEKINLKLNDIEKVIQLADEGRRRHIVILTKGGEVGRSMEYLRVKNQALKLKHLYLKEIEENTYDCFSLLKSLAPEFYDCAEKGFAINKKKNDLQYQRDKSELLRESNNESRLYYKNSLMLLNAQKDSILKKQKEYIV